MEILDEESAQTPEASDTPVLSPLRGAAVLIAPLALAACGAGSNGGTDVAAGGVGTVSSGGSGTVGGGAGGIAPTTPPGTGTSTPTPTAGDSAASDSAADGSGALSSTVTDATASRFLAQASTGATRELIDRVKSIGYAAWLDEQFTMTSQTRWDALVAGGFSVIGNRFNQSGFDACAWRKLIAAPDTLRQRVVLALSEILVVGIDGLTGSWPQFAAAAYLDLLDANAFGNYRTLLEGVALNMAMGEFLTFRGNAKYNPKTGALPDENFARELMQLFTIGLVQLNQDGTPKLSNGKPQETYGLDDITGLARVFTGWDYDFAGRDSTTPDYARRPMIQVPNRHETGAKTFLGKTIPAGGDGASDLKAALDILFAHPNVAPFIGRQLIQRLVTSNPSPAYVARVAAVFNNDGRGVKGNLQAVIKAILLDTEARSASLASGAGSGKQREPILRFTAWARACNATSPSNAWAIGNTSDAASRLGQSPLRSSSVFNFFRPGYVPPNSAIAGAGLVAPEFQLTNESSTVGYINFMHYVVINGVGDVKGDYKALVALADNPTPLLAELNAVLAAGQLSRATVSLIASAVNSMPHDTDAKRLQRVQAAIVLVLAAPEFIIQH